MLIVHCRLPSAKLKVAAAVQPQSNADEPSGVLQLGDQIEKAILTLSRHKERAVPHHLMRLAMNGRCLSLSILSQHAQQSAARSGNQQHNGQLHSGSPRRDRQFQLVTKKERPSRSRRGDLFAGCTGSRGPPLPDGSAERPDQKTWIPHSRAPSRRSSASHNRCRCAPSMTATRASLENTAPKPEAVTCNNWPLPEGHGDVRAPCACDSFEVAPDVLDRAILCLWYVTDDGRELSAGYGP